MRSPPPGNEMKAQRAPVDFCRSCRTTLSRLVFEPPDCLSCPGFFFAASMNSASVRDGASAFTAITAGSRTRRAIGVKSRSVTLASRSEEHTSELQSQSNLVCRLLLEKKKKKQNEKCDTPTKDTQQQLSTRLQPSG